MAYFALKPCRLGGRAFRIGDEVPEDLIVPGAEKNLLKMGVLTSVEAERSPAASAQALDIRVPLEEGELPLTITRDGLEALIRALTGPADAAPSVIAEMADRDALILVDMLAGRKATREAAHARAQELEAGEGR